MGREYVKHLVECNCVLPQFRGAKLPVFHRFVVFSELRDDGSVQPSVVECNNCGAIHRVHEVGASKPLPRETFLGLVKIDELRGGLPPELVKILDAYHCDLPTWQECAWLLREQRWGRQVILSREEADDLVVGKYVTIVGANLFVVDTFTSDS